MKEIKVGGLYHWIDDNKIEGQLQDKDRTLKIFIDKRQWPLTVRLYAVLEFNNKKLKHIMQYNREQKMPYHRICQHSAKPLVGSNFQDVKLTQKQIYQLTEGKNIGSEKKQHLIKLAKNFGITIYRWRIEIFNWKPLSKWRT